MQIQSLHKQLYIISSYAMRHNSVPCTSNDGLSTVVQKWQRLNVSGLQSVKNVLADGGYTGESFATDIKNILGASVQIAKCNELHTFAVIPQRWVVEHSFAWLDK